MKNSIRNYISQWKYWLVILLLMPLVAFLYYKSTGVSLTVHNKIIQSNAELRNTDSLIKQSVLNVRFGLAVNFDELSEYSSKLYEIQNLYFNDIDKQTLLVLSPAFLDLENSLYTLRSNVKFYKSHLAIYNNSKKYFFYLSQEIKQELLKSDTEFNKINDLINQLLLAMTKSDTDRKQSKRVEVILSMLVDSHYNVPDKLREKLSILIRHGTLFIEHQTEIYDLIVKIMDKGTVEKIKILTKAYNVYYSEKLNASRQIKMVWGILTILLILLILFTFYRLFTTINKLNRYAKSLSFDKYALDQHAIVSVADAKGNITYVNEKFTAISGFHSKELIGNNHRLLKSEKHDDVFFKEMWETISTGKVWHGEIKNNKKDGGFYWVNSTIVPRLGDDGRPFQYVSIRTDITEQKLIEENTKEEQIFFNGITEALAEGVYAQDSEGRCTYANPMAEKLLGWTIQDMMGKSIHELVHFQDNECNHLPVSKCNIFISLSKQEFLQTDEEVFWRKDGSKMPVSVSAVPLFDKSNKPTGGIIAFQDITERKSQAKALATAVVNAEDANAAKSAFLANMSHEIRTPMNAIIGMSYLALQTKLDDSQRNYISKVNSSAEDLLRLINDILDFSKIEANKLEIEYISFTLEEVLDSATDLLVLAANKKGLALLVEIENDVPLALIGDSLRLRQSIVNFLNNAIKFTEKGEVVITVRLLKKINNIVTLNFSVKDTGIGMTTKQKERLFKAFSQVDISTTRKYGGTGLGLAITQQLIELMGGVISVETEPNKGSTFSFILDFEISQVQPIKNINSAKGGRILIIDDNEMSRETIDEKLLEDINILLVEDNKFNQELALSLLEMYGTTADLAENGQQAVERVEKQSYDLILMDCQMPIMDGYAATKEIRNRLGSNTPIIAMTANVMPESIECAKSAGMNDHIAKPINIDDMLSKIVKWASKDKSQVNFDVKNQLSHKAVNDLVTSHIDIEVGIAFSGKNKSLYYQLLSRFLEEFTVIAETLENLLNENEIEKSILITHTLKGSSASIGTTLLHTLAGNIESHCINKAIDKAKASIPELKLELQHVINDINSLLQPKEPESTKQMSDTSTSNKGVVSEETLSIIARLRQHIESFDADSELIYKELLSSISNIQEKQALVKVESSLNNYDFEQALIELNKVYLG